MLGAAALLGLGLSACIGGGITDNTTALYGVPDSGWMDTDGDGSPDNQDCDPENPDIYPDAPETSTRAPASAGGGWGASCIKPGSRVPKSTPRKGLPPPLGLY